MPDNFYIRCFLLLHTRITRWCPALDNSSTTTSMLRAAQGRTICGYALTGARKKSDSCERRCAPGEVFCAAHVALEQKRQVFLSLSALLSKYGLFFFLGRARGREGQIRLSSSAGKNPGSQEPLLQRGQPSVGAHACIQGISSRGS